MTVAGAALVVAGIDVGGPRKGFHAVALRNGRYQGQFTSGDAATLVAWCVETIRASVIAVDAPCRWSVGEKSRPAERALHAQGIHCFFTPTRDVAQAHPKGNYRWMFNGAEVFRELEKTHPLRDSRPNAGETGCFETFPHAITWHLRGGNADAKQKRTQRRQLLEAHGVNIHALTNIDWVDAALCALTAHHAVCQRPMARFGEPATGFIVVPAQTRWRQR